MNQNFLGTSSVVIKGNPNENGALITPTRDSNTGAPKVDNNGNPLGSLRLEQETVTLTGTFLNARNRVAFLTGTIDQLTKMVTGMGLVDGKAVPGKIVQVESLNPMWKTQQPKMNPQTQEAVTIEYAGTQYPVFMQQRWTADLNALDKLIRTADDVAAIVVQENILREATKQQPQPQVEPEIAG